MFFDVHKIQLLAYVPMRGCVIMEIINSYKPQCFNIMAIIKARPKNKYQLFNIS